MPEILIGLGMSGALDGPVPDAPADRKAYEEGHAQLYAQQRLAPEEYALYSEYLPKYGAVAGQTMANLQDQLGGATDRATRASTLAQRQGDLADVQNMGPEAIAAFKAANPELAALLEESNRQAMEGLKAGSSLTGSEAREVQQYVRGGQSARGLGMGPSDVYQEAMSLGSAGAARQAQRRAYASEVMGQQMNVANVPFMQLLGRNVVAPQIAAQGAGQAMQGADARVQTDPYTSYFQDLNNTNFNAGYANRFQAQNLNAARNAALIGAGAQIAGSVMGAGGSAAGAI
jgi:hypothetical protein